MKWIFITILIGLSVYTLGDIISNLFVAFSEKIRKQIIKKLIEEQGLDKFLSRTSINYFMSDMLLLFLDIIAIISIIKYA